MSRDFVINGECLALLKFGAHVLGTSLATNNGNSALFELGLTSDSIKITPNYAHRDVLTDSFGPDMPAEVHWQLADVTIALRLIHYDKRVLQASLVESTGYNGGIFTDGTLPPAGSPLGNYVAPLASGCFYQSLNLTSPVLGQPWRFRTCYQNGPPVMIPIGTEKTIAEVNFRAVPYRAPVLGTLRSGYSPYTELISSGVVLFDHTLDTP